MLILWVVTTCIIPLVQRFSPIRIAIFPNAFSDYTGYFLFGGYFFNLRRWNLKKPWAAGLAVLMTLITLFGTGSTSLAQGKYDGFFGNQVGLNVILATLCLTSLFSDDPLAGLRGRSPRFADLVRVVSRQSLWIYVFHPLVNELLPFILPFLRREALNPILRIPLTALFSASLITLVAEGLSRARGLLSRRLSI
jgi:surface polysaccharide O-acyltransferase-like enzyme